MSRAGVAMTRLLLAATFALVAVACTKKVDPSAFDAGASTAPVLAPSTAVAAPSAPASTEPVAPLASLAPAKTPPPDKGGPKAPAKRPPECDLAKKFCAHPAAGTDPKMKALCQTNQDACKAKGGTP